MRDPEPISALSEKCAESTLWRPFDSGAYPTLLRNDTGPFKTAHRARFPGIDLADDTARTAFHVSAIYRRWPAASTGC